MTPSPPGFIGGIGILACAVAAALLIPGTDSLHAVTGMAQQEAIVPPAEPSAGSVGWDTAADTIERDAATDTVELRGRVVDAGSGQPVADAVVRLPDLERYALSASDGQFSFRDVPTGAYHLVITRIGYGEQTFSVNVRSGIYHVLPLPTQPIVVEGLEVTASWERTIEVMDRAARFRVRPRNPFQDPFVFWSSWDRDDIEASGIDHPIEFMTEGPPRVVIRPCVGLGMPSDQLCVGAPHGGRVLRGGGGGSWQGRFNPFRGPSTVRAAIYVDGRRLSRVEDLEDFRMEDIYRVESYGDRGERGIHLYTAGYLRLVAEGLVDPLADGPPPEVFELPTLRRDTLARPIPPDP
jgi:hypothetical protein